MGDPQIERVFHVNIVVRDLARSVKWYTEVLGAHVVDGPHDVSGPSVAGIGQGAQMWGVQPDEVEIRCAFLTFGDSADEVVLDMLQFVKPNASGAPPATLQHIGIGRIALKVPDVDHAYEALREQGVVFQTEPCSVDLGEGLLSGVAYACFYGPDGEALEIYGPRSASP